MVNAKRCRGYYCWAGALALQLLLLPPPLTGFQLGASSARSRGSRIGISRRSSGISSRSGGNSRRGAERRGGGWVGSRLSASGWRSDNAVGPRFTSAVTLRSSSESGGEGDGGGGGGGVAAAKPSMSPALEKATLEAEKLRLQAEKLRLEVEEQSEALETIRDKRKEEEEAKLDQLIEQLRVAYDKDMAAAAASKEGADSDSQGQAPEVTAKAGAEAETSSAAAPAAVATAAAVGGAEGGAAATEAAAATAAAATGASVGATEEAPVEVKKEEVSSAAPPSPPSLEGFEHVMSVHMNMIKPKLFLRLLKLAEKTEEASKEREILLDISEKLMAAMEKKDKKLAARLADDIKEALERAAGGSGGGGTGGAAGLLQGGRIPVDAAEAERISEKEMVESWMKQSLGKNVTLESSNLNTLLGSMNGLNESMGMGGTGGMDLPGLMTIPLWLPNSLLGYLLAAPPLKADDITTLSDSCFGIDSFYVTDVETCACAALFKGNIRGNRTTEQVFDLVSKKLDDLPGVRDRLQVFLMPDPTPRMATRNQNNPRGTPTDNGRPVFVAVSKDAQPPQADSFSLVIVTISVLLGAFTSFAYGLGTFALNSDFFQKISDGDVSIAAKAIPVALGIFGIQLVHELGHFVVSKKTGVKIAPPVFIPSLQLGLFGAITPWLSFPKTRKDAFDLAVSGPVVGLIASIAALATGISMTGSASPEMLAQFPVVPASIFHSSLLVGGVMSFTLPSIMLQDLSVAIPIHPMVIVGITGLITTALNLMPVGKLDGGRMSAATFGRKTATTVGTVTLFLQALSAIFQNYSVQLFWGLVVILLQRGQDAPSQDGLTEVGQERSALSYALLFFTILALVPFPTGWAGGGPLPPLL